MRAQTSYICGEISESGSIQTVPTENYLNSFGRQKIRAIAQNTVRERKQSDEK